MSTITITELPGSETAHAFVGADHGDVPVSFFLVHNRPGDGPELHRHPYAEVFIVHDGQATFQVDAEQVKAGPGELVVAPAGAAHGFTNTGEGDLRMTCIHPAGTMQSEWL